MGSWCSRSKYSGTDVKHSSERRTLVMNKTDICNIIREQVIIEMKKNPEVNYHMQKYKEENLLLQIEIEKLNNNIQAITTENVNLKANVQVTQDNNNLSLATMTKEQLHVATKNHVKKFVDDILADPDTNISWLPDVVERKLYINIITVAMKSLETVLETSSVNFLSHKLKFVVDPVVEK